MESVHSTPYHLEYDPPYFVYYQLQLLELLTQCSAPDSTMTFVKVKHIWSTGLFGKGYQNYLALYLILYLYFPYFRFLYIQLAALVTRMRFYTAWKLSEGACNLSGLGYSGIKSVETNLKTNANSSNDTTPHNSSESIRALGFSEKNIIDRVIL